MLLKQYPMNDQTQYLRKSLFWQRLMVGIGAISIILLVSYTVVYIIYTAPIRRGEWMVIAVFGTITTWAASVFFFLFRSTLATTQYLREPQDAFLMDVIQYQKRFWQCLCLLLLTLAVSVGGLFLFLFFSFAL